MQLDLDRVLLVPVGVAPHKTIDGDPGVEHRVAMCGRRSPATSGSASRARTPSASRPTPSTCCVRSARDELTFIVGGDMAHSLPGWRDPEGVLALARLGVAEREGVRRADIAERLAGLAGAAERVRFFDMPRLDISGSAIHRRAAAGQPVRYLVPDGVAAYIERERLYRPGPAYP